MRKVAGYIPAILFTVFYFAMWLVTGFLGVSAIWRILCLWGAAFVLDKGFCWGSVFGLVPAIHMICMGVRNAAQSVYVEIILGVALALFYLIFGFYLWKKRDEPKCESREVISVLIKGALTAVVLVVGYFVGFVWLVIFAIIEMNVVISVISMLVIPSLLVPLIWLKKRKKFFFGWLVAVALYFVAFYINYRQVTYEERITIDTAPNIQVSEYLPFERKSKIVKYDSKTLKLSGELPRIDGAAALFPVYSSFVNAVYPETTELDGGVFEYNNTPRGYRLLAEKKTDIFIGVYPSDEQRAYAEECNTTFEYTPIGAEAFVFFVHKDNPIENLTSEQIRGIYSGEITNWKEIGGKDEEIAAFQRNEGSGSQSMLKRFMGDKPIMEPPTELRNDLMSGVIEEVANYKSKSNSIGFSFRFYVEGIIKNPDIKMLSVDGVAPTAENIRSGKYPIVTPIYAVTYKEQTNENVAELLDWILSDEGQYIIEETGYVGIMSDFETKF